MPLVKIVERTPMSALGQKQTFRGAIVMFAFPSKAVAYMRSDDFFIIFGERYIR
jgi:hypothetical protein